MIRRARLDDVPTIVALGAALHAESPRYSRLRFNAEKVEATIRRMIEQPRCAVLVSENSGVINGGILAFAEPEWFTDELVAQELSLYVRPGRRGSVIAARLIAALDAWAQATGARYLQCGATTGVCNELTARLYEFLGFARVGIGVERVYHRG